MAGWNRMEEEVKKDSETFICCSCEPEETLLRSRRLGGRSHRHGDRLRRWTRSATSTRLLGLSHHHGDRQAMA